MLDTAIDDLYKLPLNEFTAARNALVKTVRGADATRVRTLAKPSVVAWAVNQTYWHARDVYERLLKAGDHLRKAQIAALKGKAGDVRTASEAHRRAIADAVQAAEKLAAAHGSHPSPDGLMRTFEALSLAAEPPEPPGRLTEALQPAGFEALAGVTPARPVKAEPHTAPVHHTTARLQPVDSKAGRERARAEAAAAKERERAEKQRQAEIAKAAAALERAKSAEALAREALTRAERDVRAAADRLARLQSER